MRFTIERLRTVVLAAGILLVGSLAAFLARGKLKNPLNLKELPKKLGVNITADASGFTLDHAFGGHSRYRIHASKAVQYKDNHAILKGVDIELFGDDGSRVDRIDGAEFEYDQQSGTAKASGPVEITLMRPGVMPAIASPSIAGKAAQSKTATEKGAAKSSTTPIAVAAALAQRGEIHVRTSGLTFDTKTGVATTAEHVDFSTVQGSGSSLGASYDAKGFLVLDKQVELNSVRGNERVLIRAQHAEFERDSRLCRMHAATADYRGGEATAGDAKVLFRDDGSVVRLDALNGFNLLTATGGHVGAPKGFMDFDEHNEPEHGHLEGGVTMDSTRETKDGAERRRMRATAPAAELEFTTKGELRHAHLERGVDMQSDAVSEGGNAPIRVNRTWKSPLVDVDFRDNGHGQAEPATLHGVQGVVVTGETQRGKAVPEPSRMAADDITGQFGPNSALSELTGTGHASVEQTNAAGTRQTSTGDKLDARFFQGPVMPSKTAAKSNTEPSAGRIESAVLEGHVVLTQLEAAKPGVEAPAPLRAWAGRADYEGAGGWLHLTESPRVEDGGLELTADKVDVARESGDAFGHGNVKATWMDAGKGVHGGTGEKTASRRVTESGEPALGGDGPAHVICEQVQLRKGAGGSGSEATFQGHARLWQEANSVSAPVIVLDRGKRTLTADSADANEPVKVVILSAGRNEPGGQGTSTDDSNATSSKPRAPSVIRVRGGGELKYSDAERKAVMRGGRLGQVVAETGSATSMSNEVELVLLPAGNHAGKNGGSAQVDRMTASGNVVVTSEGRRGAGEELVFTGETGEYVLTGTTAAPPRMTDVTRGDVTGAALIFRNRDDRVTVEGEGGKTITKTRTPK